MKQLIKVRFLLLLGFIILTLTPVCTAMPTPTEPIQQTLPGGSEQEKTTEILKKLKQNCNDLATMLEAVENKFRSEDFVEQQMSLAELNELIKKVQDDLSTRIDFIDRPDKEEIIKVLKNKLQNLMKHLEEIESITNPNLLNQRHSWQKKVLWGLGITTTILLIAALGVASYDDSEGSLTIPSFERFKDNLSKIGRKEPEVAAVVNPVVAEAVVDSPLPEADSPAPVGEHLVPAPEDAGMRVRAGGFHRSRSVGDLGHEDHPAPPANHEIVNDAPLDESQSTGSWWSRIGNWFGGGEDPSVGLP